MVKPIVFDGFVIEPRAIACFPFQATDHAELCAAATGHMVTALLQLNSGGAVETALPAFFLGNFGKTLRGFVFGTFATCMPLAITSAANLGSTPATFSVLAASIGATRCIKVNVRRLDPFATASSRAIDAILGGIFLIFLIPFHLKFRIEKFLNVLQWYMVLCAAFWRHVLRVSNG